MIKIYTDGACSGNPGVGASAMIVVKNGETFFKDVAFADNTTNNIAELQAVSMAIDYVINNNILECRIFSDSKYVVDGINDWMWKWVKSRWISSSKKTIKNLELWQSIYERWRIAKTLSNISIHHVKGHHTDKWNIEVDKLAQGGVKYFKNEINNQSRKKVDQY